MRGGVTTRNTTFYQRRVMLRQHHLVLELSQLPGELAGEPGPIAGDQDDALLGQRRCWGGRQSPCLHESTRHYALAGKWLVCRRGRRHRRRRRLRGRRFSREVETYPVYDALQGLNPC